MELQYLFIYYSYKPFNRYMIYKNLYSSMGFSFRLFMTSFEAQKF